LSEVSVPDVHTQPWCTDATVIVDVASLTHTVAEDIVVWLGFPAKERVNGKTRWSAEFVAMRRTIGDNLHRLVDLLEHHGVQTRRLLLSLPTRPFPPGITGWRASEDGEDLKGEQQRADFLFQSAEVGEKTRQQLRMAGRDDVKVRVLDGYFSADGEHCIDEQCVLAAVMESWTTPQQTVFVLSWDADVAVAPWLAGGGPILLARDLTAAEAKNIKRRLARHRPDHIPSPELPPHLRLTTESLRELLVLPKDLPADAVSLRKQLAAKQTQAPPSLRIETDGHDRHLVDPSQKDNQKRSRRLTLAIDAPHPTRWSDLRREGLLRPGRPCEAVVVVDSFGLMTTANRARIPARIPSVGSVERALAPLGIRGDLAQLAVIPDILDADPVDVADRIDGHPLDQLSKEALVGPLRDGIRAMDRMNQAAIDSYRDDERPETIATTSAFGSSGLRSFGSARALEEKESVVLLAADIMWALLRTDLPVIVLTDRADLMVALHVIESHVDPSRRMRERIVRIGMHADTFRGEGFNVARSKETSPWTTVLLTARMIADLLRLDSAHEDEPTELPPRTDIVVYDPISDAYEVLDAERRSVGSVPLREFARLPLHMIERLTGLDADEATAKREQLTAELKLHLDLRLPLPRPVLLRRERRNRARVVVRAEPETAEVTGHATGLVRIRRAAGAGPVRREVESPVAGYTPPDGAVVSLVVEEAGGACTLILPDLGAVPAEYGRPRPATVLDPHRVRLEAPLDPEDHRDDVGAEVRLAPLLGPFPTPRTGQVLLVTHLNADRVQAVSTAVTWPAGAPERAEPLTPVS
jgi:hypothetical protein